MQQGLGGLQFITGAVEFFRPFLGPLYAWASAGPRFSRPKLPIMAVPIMRYLAEELRNVSAMPCTKKATHLEEVYRIDATAEGLQRKFKPNESKEKTRSGESGDRL